MSAAPPPVASLTGHWRHRQGIINRPLALGTQLPLLEAMTLFGAAHRGGLSRLHLPPSNYRPFLPVTLSSYASSVAASYFGVLSGKAIVLRLSAGVSPAADPRHCYHGFGHFVIASVHEHHPRVI